MTLSPEAIRAGGIEVATAEANKSPHVLRLTRALSATPRTAEEQTTHALIGGTVVSEARKPPFSPAGSNRQPPFLQPFRMRSQASRTASR